MSSLGSPEAPSNNINLPDHPFFVPPLPSHRSKPAERSSEGEEPMLLAITLWQAIYFNKLEN